MSFPRLLAASKSLMGIKKKPGPYKMSQNKLLPKFEQVPKDEVTSPTAQSELGIPSNPGAGHGQSTALAELTPPAGRMKRVLVWLAAKSPRWARRRMVDQEGRAVPAELSLERLKVVRNDLCDSDFQVVPSGKVPERAADEANGKKPAQRRPLGMVWNRLSARLLRQATLEFNSVQKERGKLLSQASDGSRGAGVS